MPSDALVTVHRLVVPDFVPTPLNKLMRGRIRDRIRLACGDRQLIAYYAREQGLPLATARRRVSIVITGTRADPDGLLKSLLDGLVHAGLLVDDSSTWLELGHLEVSLSGPRQTTVVLEDLA
jgi:hypothetical protein